MPIEKFYQLVDIPEVKQNRNASINYSEIADDCDNKTISLMSAIYYLSLSLAGMSEDKPTNDENISRMSGIITDLAELGLATNKISSSANYYSGYWDGKNGN